MAPSTDTPCIFHGVLFIIVSLCTHLTDLALRGYCIFVMYQQDFERGHFSLILGFTILPLVVVQLVSAILYLGQKGEKLSSLQFTKAALIHVFQFGFIWRHFLALHKQYSSLDDSYCKNIFRLRMLFLFSSSLPVILIQGYYVIAHGNYSTHILISVCATFVSAVWSLSTYTCADEQQTSSGSISAKLAPTVIWRTGEIISRILVLVLFANVYHYWLLLVFTGHWVCMLICVLTEVLGVHDGKGTNKIRTLFSGILTAYMYIFCFVNTSQQHACRRYSVYYLIMFLENTTLVLSWVLTLHGEFTYSSYALLCTTAGSFMIGAGAMFIIVSHTYCSPPTGDLQRAKSTPCINYKLSNCAKHELNKQRPWTPGYSGSRVDEVFAKHPREDAVTEVIKTLNLQNTVNALGTSHPRLSQCQPNAEKAAAWHKNSSSECNSCKSSQTESSKGCSGQDHVRSGSETFVADLSSSTSSESTSSENCERSRSCDTCSIDTSSTIRNFYFSDSYFPTDYSDYSPSDHKYSKEKQSGRKLYKSKESLHKRDCHSDGYSSDMTMSSYKLPTVALACSKKYLMIANPTATDESGCCSCSCGNHDDIPSPLPIDMGPDVNPPTRSHFCIYNSNHADVRHMGHHSKPNYNSSSDSDNRRGRRSYANEHESCSLANDPDIANRVRTKDRKSTTDSDHKNISEPERHSNHGSSSEGSRKRKRKEGKDKSRLYTIENIMRQTEKSIIRNTLDVITEDTPTNSINMDVLKQYSFSKGKQPSGIHRGHWYDNSDSGDSAFPQDTLTCSSPDAAVVSDGESLGSIEMII